MLEFADYRESLNQERMIIESFLDEMANLPSADTGLGYFIWIGEVGGQHGPRVKVSNSHGKMNVNNCFVMSVAKIPEVLTPRSCKLRKSEVDDISDWIKLNYDVLMKMWNVYETGNGSIIKLQDKLKKI